ncbi:MAG TPA: retropepsin-like aspartic protease [Pyrinomonadaceae bacterium]
MSYSFNTRHGLILVRAELFGPLGNIVLRLALDTGATGTTINAGLLMVVGYDPSSAPERVEMTTGSGVEYASRLSVSRISPLGQERSKFPVIVHTLPPSARVDGLLGLDFFRAQELRLDFRSGIMTLG